VHLWSKRVNYWSCATSSSCVLANTRLLWPSATVEYRRLQCSAHCCSLPMFQMLASWSSHTACHTTSSPTTHSSSSAWTAPMPCRPSTGSPNARPQFTSASCRTAYSSTLTSQRWSFSAPLLSSAQLPTSPPSTLLEALCRSQTTAHPEQPGHSRLPEPGHNDAKALLRSPHWLPVRQQVAYKVALLTHKVRTTAIPTYLSELVQAHAPPRALRSSDAPLLVVPRIHTELARRTFSVAAPSTWNSLPADNW